MADTGSERDRPDAPGGADRLERSLEGSAAARTARAAGRRLRRLVVASFLYRWLTAEPDPDVIVIDLRETRTVGPVLALLDRLLEGLAAAARGSRAVRVGRALWAAVLAAPVRAAGVAAVGAAAAGLLAATATGLTPARAAPLVALGVAGLAATRETRSWARLRETRPVRLLVAAFEPPEPPERAARSDTDGSAGPAGPATDPGGDDADDARPDPGGSTDRSDPDRKL